MTLCKDRRDQGLSDTEGEELKFAWEDQRRLHRGGDALVDSRRSRNFSGKDWGKASRQWEQHLSLPIAGCSSVSSLHISYSLSCISSSFSYTVSYLPLTGL